MNNVQTCDKPIAPSRSYKPGGVLELLSIALPMMASSACDTAMTFVARLFLARLGPSHMSAALTGGMMSQMLLAFFFGLIGYGTALVAQYYGAKQKDNCPIVVTQGLLIAVIAYPIILLTAPVVVAIFKKSGIDAEQLKYQTIFFNVLIYGAIFSLLRSAYSCFFAGIGKARVIMISAVVSMVVNIIANYLLVFGKFGFPALGMKGSALGTIAGSIAGLLVLLYAYYLGKDSKGFNIQNSYKVDWQIMYKLFKYGYPAGLEFLFAMMAFLAQITLFQSRGPIVATAATITYNWDMVAYVPLVGIEIAITSLVGRYVGAREFDNAHNTTISGIKMGFFYSAIILILFLSFPILLINVFHPSGDTTLFNQAKPLTLFMVRLMAIYVLADAVIIAYCGALRGAGDTFWAMFINVSLHMLMVGVLYVLFNVFHVSAYTAWAFIIIWIILLSLAFFFRYRTGKWKEIDLIQHT